MSIPKAMDNAHYRKLESFYLNANLNKEIFYNTEIEISNQKAIIKMPIAPKYFHALGAIHGFTYFKMLDDAAFFAAQSIEEDLMVLTANFNLHFTKPASSGNLLAKGSVKSATKGIIYAQSTLYNEKGETIAFGQGSFVKSITQLKSSPLYR